MMTRDEIYGGFFEFVFENPDELYVIPDGTDFRVLLFGASDIGTGVFEVRLPLPTSIRQHGWLVYLIINDTSRDIDIATNNGNSVLGFLGPGEAAQIGLLSDQIPPGEGLWVFKKQPYVYGLGTQISDTMNIGSTSGADDDVDAYNYLTDTWIVLPEIPVPAGTGRDIAATDVPDGGPGDFAVYYGQQGFFYERLFFTTSERANPGYRFQNTGLGTILGSAIGDMMHVSNSAINDARKMEAYGTVGDSWTTGPDYPDFSSFGVADPETTICTSIGEAEFYQWAFISPMTPDNAAAFVAYDQITQVYFAAAYPPWPRGPFRPSCVGIDGRLHFQNGSFSSASTVAESTDSHYEFNPFLNSWQVLPPSPAVGRGMGCRGLNDPRDRYTFGMGETTSVPSEVHFEYNLTTRSYTARGTFSWGTARAIQESKWAKIQ